MTVLYPRIPRGLFDAIWHRIEEASDVASLAESAATSHPLATYAQTGGRRVSAKDLQLIRDTVVEMAEGYGYPHGSNQASRANFDASCAAWFVEGPEIPMGEALRPSVWSFIGGVLLPDVSRWRFGENLRRERFEGGVRNTFQRLWLRGFLLDRGPEAVDRWKLIRSLTEDAFVSICERPGLSANPRFAVAIGEGWLRSAERVGRERMEDVNRTAIKNLRATYAVVHPEVLDDDAVRAIVDTAYTGAET